MSRLQGRDISAVASPETVDILVEVLTKQTATESDYALALGMRRSSPTPKFEDALALLKALLRGLQDPRKVQVDSQGLDWR